MRLVRRLISSKVIMEKVCLTAEIRVFKRTRGRSEKRHPPKITMHRSTPPTASLLFAVGNGGSMVAAGHGQTASK